MRRLCLVALLLAALISAAVAQKSHRDYVPDEKSAVRIAEAVLIAQYGEERVNAQRPFGGRLNYKGVWIVEANADYPPHKGGGMEVWIDKHSGCIENVLEHSK